MPPEIKRNPEFCHPFLQPIVYPHVRLCIPTKRCVSPPKLRKFFGISLSGQVASPL